MGIILLLATGCNVLKFVPNDKSLVDANFVKIEGKEKFEDIKEQILLVPNRKMLGVIKFNLWSYYFGQKIFKNDSVYGRIVNRESGKKVVTHGNKVNKRKYFFTDIVGEKPIYLDQLLIIKSERNLKQYLYQKGYYKADITSKVKTIFKRSYITYTINPGKPYLINNVYYNGSDRVMDKAANQFALNSLIKINDPLDSEKLTIERDRLTEEYRNNGFYYFNKAFIEIKADTGGYNHGSNVYFNVSNPGDLKNARQQIIQEVLVEMEFNESSTEHYTVEYKGIKYKFNGYNIKPNIINRSIILKPQELFSQNKLEATYKKLIGLGLFKAVNISIFPYKKDSVNKVMVYINLKPKAKHDYIFEPQVITSDKQTNLNSQDNNPRNYGFASSFVLNNKNVFRNAEDFNLKLRLAAERQFGNSSGAPIEIPFLNKKINSGNYEANLTFELLYPKLVGLKKMDLSPKLQQNRTSININALAESNSNYSRNSIPINFTWQTVYDSKKNKSIYFYYSPIQLSFNSSKISSDFLKRLDNPLDSYRLVRMFRNYIIPSQKASIYFSNSNTSPNKYWNIRSNVFELSGNLAELIYRKIGNDYSKDKKIFGLHYFQYFRTDIDAVRYKLITKNRTFVYRINAGIAVPYGNSEVIPFERQFYVGGSNSLRAWRPRVLGPGSHNSTSDIQIDKTGDMMIVSNAEYRFAIAPGTLYGAVFLDAGNIWAVTKSASDDSRFKLDNFYKQIALNTGLGFRIDLDFFILRIDLGLPIHNPTKLENERWVIKEIGSLQWLKSNTLPLIAVGYPF